jgi:hypothetical protein
MAIGIEIVMAALEIVTDDLATATVDPVMAVAPVIGMATLPTAAEVEATEMAVVLVTTT